jgi:hypothetical protein
MSSAPVRSAAVRSAPLKLAPLSLAPLQTWVSRSVGPLQPAILHEVAQVLDRVAVGLAFQAGEQDGQLQSEPLQLLNADAGVKEVQAPMGAERESPPDVLVYGLGQWAGAIRIGLRG